MRSHLVVPLVTLAFLTAGCTSHVADTKQYSGFLGDYSQLKMAESASGKPTMRWISPDYHAAKYPNVIYTPIVYYPAAHPTQRISQQTLDAIRQYADQKLKDGITVHKNLVTQKGPNTMVVRAAITAVGSENEGVQFYEVVPVAAVIAGTMAATGHRTQNSTLYLEVEASDAQTGKPLIKVVRKAFGKTLPNNSSPITLNDLRPGIDEMVRDAVSFSAP
ncbi:DUF3313 domain-containing protein [Pantoea phytobeneficialis]|uniref:DUF3313 domain-containing protein n=1 Tax=Pantoea phytobeneficialis TaxID=2052056 RepID=A0AAP9H408_9GAMM|nr:DUF3313 domain-containing protein [Pantoea phytobeneficialis]MDO6406425.1 DUF3313 domain-containing protein [Pantoea phytobeneficialis]QGR06092.1 hypothetical protein CTZ24_06585 [Pantoea phytobeneficialis]